MAKINQEERRKNLSFFHLMLPIVIICMLSFINTCNWTFGSVVILIVVKIIIVLWQAISLKNFLDSVY